MNDPYLILGVSEEADDHAIESAYLAGIKHSPPERDPERFQALRQAYECISTQRQRIAYELFATTPPDAADLLARATANGTPARPDAALFVAVLRGGM